MILPGQTYHWGSRHLNVHHQVHTTRQVADGSDAEAILRRVVVCVIGCQVDTECDGYVRLWILGCVASTAINVSFCTLGHFFLELLRYDTLSMLWVSLLGGSVFNVQMLIVNLRLR
jgi:hypothetical protein